MPDHFFTFRVGVKEDTVGSNLNRYLTQNDHVIKPSDTSRTNTTTSADDPHLSLYVSANTSYWVQAMIIYAGANGNFQLRFAAPSGSTFLWVSDSLGGSVVNSYGQVSRTQQGLGNEPTMGGAASTTNQCSMPKGVLQVGVNGGPFRVQWAQASSSATATIVRAASILSIRRFTS